MEGANAAAASSADGNDTAGATAVLWAAAGDAMAWKASIREHAARRERKKARDSVAESYGELGRVVDAYEQAADGRGRADTEVLGRALSTTRVAAEMQSLASKALARSSRLHRKAGAGLKRASMAYKRAAEPRRAADMRERAARAYANARASAGIAARVRRDARGIMQSADRMDAGEAEWPPAGGGGMAGDAGVPSPAAADMRESAGRAHTGSNGTEKKLEDAVRAAAEMRKVSAEAARRSAENAAKAVAECVGGGPDMQRAVDAWAKAMAAANRADADKR